ncbi:hypothetical protein AB205_0130240 [Aquarana catesbeiana]|uniref:Uncharacterized protein n=1 Tax=Aquarana catesbeiana TaxID=8400 RepID=A0A2G9S1C6_AQUCT|nr:hypothetical protein AB205_0130240 [Aquarana catesbeiana]
MKAARLYSILILFYLIQKKEKCFWVRILLGDYSLMILLYSVCIDLDLFFRNTLFSCQIWSVLY